jgi:membrane-bound lytic murein transglycosylase D
MRIWLLPTIIAVLTACSSSVPPVQPDYTVASPAITQPQTVLPQNVYNPATHSGAFHKPDELEPAVEFWRKTYTKWHRSEVAIHDDRYLDVIYEVMVLPGYVDESLTSEQKEMVKQRRDFWKAQLFVLESKVPYNAPLTVNDRQFRKIFRESGLPEDLAYLPHVESSFQPSARSSAGAKGMWQFTNGAAKTFMPGGRVDLCFDPFASAIGAARYLSYAYGKLGDWPAAITSYNHGIGGMKRAQNRVGRDFVRIVNNYDGPAFGFASRNYYAQFLAAREIASNPWQYLP